jgi:hypothetical protein
MSILKDIKAIFESNPENNDSEKEVEIPGEVYAAIAMALYDADEEEHDIENTVITIDRVIRNYSPWSSKIYQLRDIPFRIPRRNN